MNGYQMSVRISLMNVPSHFRPALPLEARVFFFLLRQVVGHVAFARAGGLT